MLLTLFIAGSMLFVRRSAICYEFASFRYLDYFGLISDRGSFQGIFYACVTQMTDLLNDESFMDEVALPFLVLAPPFVGLSLPTTAVPCAFTAFPWPSLTFHCRALCFHRLPLCLHGRGGTTYTQDTQTHTRTRTCTHSARHMHRHTVHEHTTHTEGADLS